MRACGVGVSLLGVDGLLPVSFVSIHQINELLKSAWLSVIWLEPNFLGPISLCINGIVKADDWKWLKFVLVPSQLSGKSISSGLNFGIIRDMVHTKFFRIKLGDSQQLGHQ